MYIKKRCCFSLMCSCKSQHDHTLHPDADCKPKSNSFCVRPASLRILWSQDPLPLGEPLPHSLTSSIRRTSLALASSPFLGLQEEAVSSICQTTDHSRSWLTNVCNPGIFVYWNQWERDSLVADGTAATMANQEEEQSCAAERSASMTSARTLTGDRSPGLRPLTLQALGMLCTRLSRLCWFIFS